MKAIYSNEKPNLNFQHHHHHHEKEKNCAG